MIKEKIQEYYNKIVSTFFFYKYYNQRTFRKHKDLCALKSDELKVLQERKLLSLLDHVTKNVPFYKKYRNQIDFENFSMEELKKLPVVDKTLMRGNITEFIAENKSGIDFKTSGSTGEPFAFKVPHNHFINEWLTAMRSWKNESYKYQFGDPVITLRSYTPEEGMSIFKVDKRYNFWYISPFHLNKANLNSILTFISKSKSHVLRGYPSSLFIFTDLLIENNIPKPKNIKLLVTSSETLLPNQRAIMENYWQTNVSDYYGLNEGAITVYRCEAGHYHNNDDYGLVEILNDNSIIGTSLNNFVFPFIRYDTGDKAIMPHTQLNNCSCGSNLSIPFLTVEGRSDDILIKNDGTKISTANFSTAMKDFKFLKQFQIIQYPNRSLKLKLVLEDKSPNYIKKIEKKVVDRLGQVNLDIILVDSIKRDLRTGKIKVSIQKQNYD